MIGSLLDERYRILRRLGGGGMGDVYLAEHIGLRRLEALKVLKPELADEPSFISRFRREARANNRVVHPNIIGVHDFGRLPDGRLYLSTEYADGESLADVLGREEMLTVARAVHVMRQLADAVAHAHELGVVHRDLKPENLLLVAHRGQPDMLKVLDFGIAKIISPGWRETVGISAQGEIFGTPPYMAPEQIAGNATDPRVDLYAMGCLFFELLVGVTPFTGRPMEIMHKHLHEVPAAPSTRAKQQVSRALDAIVLRLLAKSPNDRYASARELLAALDALPVNAALATSRELNTFAEGEDVTVSHDSLPPGPSDAQQPALHELAGRLAESLFEAGEPDLELLTSAGWLAQLVEERRLVESEVRRLERLTDDAEQSARANDATLRFGAAELSFARDQAKHRGEPVAGEVDARLRALEVRVAAHRDSAEREQHELIERGIELAARGGELDEQMQERARDVAVRALELEERRGGRELAALATQVSDRLRRGG